MNSTQELLIDNQQSFLSGGGEMGALIRAYNWAESPLGVPATWPQSLKTSISIMLRSGYPIFVWWGQEMIMFNNDAYLPVLGNKHPASLGSRARETWDAIWEQIGPMMDQVLNKGEQIYAQDLLFLLDRKGFSEECYFTFSYSPIQNDNGGVGGIFCASNEETPKVLRQRRLKTLKDISDLSSTHFTLKNVYKKFVEVFEKNPNDLPFSLLYVLNEDGTAAHLEGSTGFQTSHDAAPSVIYTDESHTIWPLGLVKSSNKMHIVRNLREMGCQFPGGPWNEPSEAAAILPIHKSGQGQVTGFLIVGISQKLEFEEEYQSYLELTARQISTVISNIVALEEERKRVEALAEIDKAKTVFFSNVSHEFRTPLTLMLGPLEEAIHDPSSIPENQVRLDTAHRNAMRLLKLVNTLLDFSRLEAGRVQAVFRQTDICQLTADLSSSFRSIVESAGLRLNIHCSKISNPVFVDTTMWERIVFNLLSNAYKFTFEGEISLTLKEVEKKIELIVKDTGTGIPEKELSKLFSRFHRIENAKGRTHEGSGIGLAMVSELAKLHGGTVKVESIYGSGTSFIISIPTGMEHLPSSHLADKEAKNTITLNSIPNVEEELGIYLTHSEPVSVHENKSYPWKKEKILLADDNVDMREYLVRLLGKNYDIRAVADGLEALKAIEEDKPSLVLSDIMMPNLDGLGLLKKLRANEKTKTIPVIFISARAGEEAKIEGIEAGADDYLVKPFTSKELFARVQSNISLFSLRRKAEESIKSERERLYQMFMQAPAMIAITRGSDLVFELANDFYLRVVGKTKDIIGKSVFEVFPEIKGEAIEDILRNVYKTGERFVGKEILVKLDTDNDGIPEDLYFNFVYEPYRNASGKVDGILNHAIEVTDQVQARRKIEESEERFRTMAECTDILIAVDDETGKATYFNRAWVELTGRSLKELLDFGWANLVHPDDREAYLYIYMNAFEKRVPFTGEFRVLDKEGHYRWLHATGPPRFRADGSFAGYISSCVDITEHKLSEESLVLKNEQLLRINNDLDNFIYTASHDLKAPMSNIEGLLNSLRDHLKSEKNNINDDTEIFLQLMESSINRFKTTILDLTEITKVQKALDEDVEEVNLSEMVEDVKLSIQDKILISGSIIQTDFSIVNTVKFSKRNFKSIIYNLLSNAIKYLDKNRPSEIFIKTEKTEGYFVLTFQDNGLGINEQNIKKMFSMFKRFHDHVEGTGIGLYIVKRIIDNSGGKIEVESEVGKGTIFKIYLAQ